MPLDTGAVTHRLLVSAGVDMSDAADVHEDPLSGVPSIGAAFRAMRLRRGRSLQDASDSTRIRRAYLEALEEMRLEDLPSRPFTIGYVRAYARELGIDGDAAVARFKQDMPAESEQLRAPVGVRKHSDARISVLAVGGALVISAVLLWNLAQHAMSDDAPPPSAIAEAAPSPQAAGPAATVAVSAAQPAPQESTLPTPYVTPGLQVAGAEAVKTPTPAAAAEAAAAIDPKSSVTFIPHGAVYGAPQAASTVTIQAKKSVSLVVRGADGSVYFAQQLKAGEAYRAPADKSLSLDVSNTRAVDLYVGGQIHTGLSAQVTPISRLTQAPASAG